MQTQSNQTEITLPRFLQTQHRADINFPVELQPIFTKTGKQISGSLAVVRPDFDETISVVSSRYSLLKHGDAISSLMPLVEKLGAPQEKYYLENRGAKLVAEYTFKDITSVVKTGVKSVGDVVALRVNITNSYNTKAALSVQVGAMVLKCTNGMMGFDGVFDLRYRHLGAQIDIELPQPEIITAAFGKTIDDWNDLGGKEVKDAKKKAIILEAKNYQVISERHIEGNHVEFGESKTAWDLYNVFTNIITHQQRSQQSGKLQRQRRLNAIFRHEFASAKH